MALALAASAVAPATLRVSRKHKATCSVGCPAPKRQRIALRDPIAAAAGQGFVNWAVESPAQPDAVDIVTAPSSPVLVAFRVPSCRLAFGEHLRLVGSCPQLGSWDVAKAPALQWAAGDDWTASVALPPGEHTFKLVLMRQNGSPYWELGVDRSLQLPAIAAGGTSVDQGAGPLLSVTCGWGNTALMEVTPDPAQLVAAAEAAAAGPAVQAGWEHGGGLGGLPFGSEMEHNDASLAMVSHNIYALLASEQQQLEAQHAQHAQQQHAVAQAAAALNDAAAAVHEAQAVVVDAAASWAADDLEGAAGSGAGDDLDGAAGSGAAGNGTAPLTEATAASGAAAAAAAAPGAELPAGPEAPAALLSAAPAGSVDGEQLFRFGSDSGGPTALELARQQLVSRLPEEAAAGLEAALHSMHSAPGSRRQRAALASLALHGPAVPAEQLYGVGSHERHPLAAHPDSPGQGSAAEEAAEEADSLAAELGRRLSLTGGGGGGASASASSSATHEQHPAADPVLRGSFPGAAVCLAAQSLFTVGSLLWSAGRAAMPAARRRAADAAVVLACTAAAAVALS